MPQDTNELKQLQANVEEYNQHLPELPDNWRETLQQAEDEIFKDGRIATNTVQSSTAKQIDNADICKAMAGFIYTGTPCNKDHVNETKVLEVETEELPHMENVTETLTVEDIGDRKLVTYSMEGDMMLPPPEDGPPMVLMADFNDGPAKTAIVEKLADGGFVIHEPGEISPEALKRLAAETDQFEKSVQQIADAAKDLYAPMNRRPRWRKGAAQQPPSAKKVFNHKKAKRKQQARSRKKNRR